MTRKNMALDLGVRKLVQDEIERREALKDIEDPDREENVELNFHEDKTASKIFSAFPSSKGYYAKIYRLSEDGKWEIKDYTIDAPEIVDDLEIEVKNIVLQKGWGPGTYIVVVRNRDKKGFFVNRRVVVGEPTIVERMEQARKAQQGISGTIIPFPQSDPAEQTIKLMQAARNITAPPPVDVTGLAKVIADAQKSGAEMVSKSDSSDGLTPVVLKIMENQTSILTELIRQVNQKPVVDESSIMERMLKTMKDLGVIGQPPAPKEDLLESLTKLKAAGIIPERKEEDALSSTEKIMSLINLIRPLVLPESGEKPSALIEALRVVGPQVPKMVENVTGAFRDAAEVTRMKIASQTGISPERFRYPRPEQVPLKPPVKGEPVAELTQSQAKAPESGGQNPIIADILQRIDAQDESFFPQLKGLLSLFIGPHVIDGIVSGQITLETFAYLGKPYKLDQAFSTENARKYLEKFKKWLTDQLPPEESFPSGSNVIVAACPTCGAQFEFKSREDFEHSNICDCGTVLTEISLPA